ncbi:MAG: hypothetical protein AAF677_05380 [Pseudomonadota bacterium]
MRELTLFETVVAASVERIPITDVRYAEAVDGREVVVSNVIARNVFTDFDHKLSRHLASVRGGGFPGVTVTRRMREADDETAPWSEGRTTHYLTGPHALRAIALRAMRDSDIAVLSFASADSELEIVGTALPERRIERTEIEAFGAAIEFCRNVGDFAFLDFSGDFDLLMVQPQGTDLAPITIDLYRGMATVPSALGRSGDGFTGALYELSRNGQKNPTARAYYAAARHAMAEAKQQAVMAFRAAAEDRILAFDKALAGRAIAGHRLDAALKLVARLRTGLGDALNGLSEDARITALDWAEAVERAYGAEGEGETHARSDAHADTHPETQTAGPATDAARRGRAARASLFEWRAAAAVAG